MPLLSEPQVYEQQVIFITNIYNEKDEKTLYKTRKN